MYKSKQAALQELQSQQLNKQQQLTGLKQKLLDEQRARIVLKATTTIKKISLLAKKEPGRFDHLRQEQKGPQNDKTIIRHKQHTA